MEKRHAPYLRDRVFSLNLGAIVSDKNDEEYKNLIISSMKFSSAAGILRSIQGEMPAEMETFVADLEANAEALKECAEEVLAAQMASGSREDLVAVVAEHSRIAGFTEYETATYEAFTTAMEPLYVNISSLRETLMSTHLMDPSCVVVLEESADLMAKASGVLRGQAILMRLKHGV